MSAPEYKLARAARIVFEDIGSQWREASSTDVKRRREIIAHSMRQCARILLELGIPDADLEPIVLLNVALFDLSREVRSDLLIPRKPGRPRDHFWRYEYQLRAVALVDWLIEGGMRVEPALKQVANAFQKAGHRSHNKGPITPDVVKTWRDDSREGGSHVGEANVVKMYLSQLRANQGDRPRTVDTDRAVVREHAGREKSTNPLI